MNRKLFFTLLMLTYFSFCVFAQENIKWQHLAAGTEFSMALRSDGALFTWGFNQNGQLGNGISSASFTTDTFHILPQVRWSYISAGAAHAVGIHSDSSLWCWGSNVVNQVNPSPQTSIVLPIQISDRNNWISVHCGQGHTLAINDLGELFSWGFNFGGQLGNGNTDNNGSVSKVNSSTSWIQASAGGYHSIAIKSDSTLWTWGFNGNGQCGLSTSNTQILTPTQVTFPDVKWRQVSAGFEYSLGLDSEGRLYGWGFNGNGQLGLGNTAQRTIPTLIDEGPWEFIAAGSALSFAIKSDGSLWGWGANIEGVLGEIPGGQTVLRPTRLSDEEDWSFVTAANGLLSGSSVFGFHALGLKREANVICVSGANYAGQLNTGDFNPRIGMSCTVGELTVSTEEITSSTLNIRLSPNPAYSHFQIETDNYFKQAKVIVLDMTGKIVHQSDYTTSNLQINIENWKTGMYLVSIRTLNQTYQTKFIKL